jgi:hypothetical protein
VRVDDPGVRGGERFRTRVPLRRPRELLRVDPPRPGPCGRRRGCSVRQQRGIPVLVQARLARCRAARVCGLVAEGGPGVDVDQDVGEVDRGSRLAMCAASAVVVSGVRRRAVGGRVALRPGRDRHVAGRERAIERGSALVNVAAELLKALRAELREQTQLPVPTVGASVLAGDGCTPARRDDARRCRVAQRATPGRVELSQQPDRVDKRARAMA